MAAAPVEMTILYGSSVCLVLFCDDWQLYEAGI
jgi:uncharacterized protein YaiE (UPF0345 family)